MSNNLISRSALIETINKITFYSVHNGEFIDGAGLKDVAYYRERDIYRAIIEAPTVDERPKGKWIKRGYIGCDTQFYWCSVCEYERSYDAETGLDDYNFCPNCGADMRSAQNLSYADNDTAQGGLASAT